MPECLNALTAWICWLRSASPADPPHPRWDAATIGPTADGSDTACLTTAFTTGLLHTAVERCNHTIREPGRGARIPRDIGIQGIDPGAAHLGVASHDRRRRAGAIGVDHQVHHDGAGGSPEGEVD